jgi:hypothetical protein
MLPLVIEATLKTPPVEGQSDCPFPLTFASQYEHLVKNRFTFTGAGSKSVDFGSLSAVGAKAILITVDKDTSPAFAPVTVTINSGTDTWEIDQGGFLMYGSTDPTAAGITAMDITYTSAVKMYVWIFG